MAAFFALIAATQVTKKHKKIAVIFVIQIVLAVMKTMMVLAWSVKNNCSNNLCQQVTSAENLVDWGSDSGIAINVKLAFLDVKRVMGLMKKIV